MSGSVSSSRGSCQPSAPSAATCSVRARAASNRGLRVSGRLSEEPLANRETVSTPAEMNTSPSPALIACIAIRLVCSEDEQ